MGNNKKNFRNKLTIIFIIISIPICILLAIRYYYILELDKYFFPEEYLIERFTNDIKDNPSNSWNYIYRGKQYFKLRKFAEAIDDFNYAIQLDKNFFYPYTLRSRVLLAEGNHFEALKSINIAIANEPKRKSNYYVKAIIFDFIGDSSNAINDYSRYLQLVNYEKLPNTVLFSLKRRAINYILTQNYNKAILDVEKALKYNSADKDLNELLNFLNTKNNKQSINDSLKIIDINKALSID